MPETELGGSFQEDQKWDEERSFLFLCCRGLVCGGVASKWAGSRPW